MVPEGGRLYVPVVTAEGPSTVSESSGAEAVSEDIPEMEIR